MSSKITPAKNYTPSPLDRAAGPAGPGALLDRLTAQVGSADLARGLLQARGHLGEDGALKAAGAARDAMSAEERAIDRAQRGDKTPFGQPKPNFAYDAATNRATRKKGFGNGL